MRTLAMILAIAYVVGAGLFIPGAPRPHINQQINVRLTGTSPAIPVNAVREKTP